MRASLPGCCGWTCSRWRARPRRHRRRHATSARREVARGSTMRRIQPPARVPEVPPGGARCSLRAAGRPMSSFGPGFEGRGPGGPKKHLVYKGKCSGGTRSVDLQKSREFNTPHILLPTQLNSVWLTSSCSRSPPSSSVSAYLPRPPSPPSPRLHLRSPPSSSISACLPRSPSPPTSLILHLRLPPSSSISAYLPSLRSALLGIRLRGQTAPADRRHCFGHPPGPSNVLACSGAEPPRPCFRRHRRGGA